MKNGIKPYFRPTLEESDCPCDELAVVIRRCWAEDPMERPDFQALKSIIRKLNKWVGHNEAIGMIYVSNESPTEVLMVLYILNYFAEFITGFKRYRYTLYLIKLQIKSSSRTNDTRSFKVNMSDNFYFVDFFFKRIPTLALINPEMKPKRFKNSMRYGVFFVDLWTLSKLPSVIFLDRYGNQG